MKKLLGAALIALLAGPVLPSELSIAGAGGLHLPAQLAFRDVYGTAALFGLDVRWLAARNFGFSAGVMTLNRRGTAVSPDGGLESMGVKLRLTSIPLTAYWHIPRGRVGIDLGAGFAYHDFEETWADDSGPATSGGKWGLLACASVAYELTSRLSVFGTVRYLNIATGRPSLLTDEVNLGGVQVLVGASWTIWR